ncbi:carboxylating nicotinate-nucleotide diphosphorylase [Candidatus Pelagibacter sp. RS40]|uniref:carboxylating nicotinate-nucleotide diphosphorylase n=1 Tax=Candidatus Pelagibacter sp. RS40 TaxID=1977865 RepID=UPI000A165A72|nr:carboxylating nicotinate-nucleotide diphosphorylase [Candidatus Pelagibacter sp. RS40]ARJ49307.1 nicotinate-nucleotide diphosphorylase (carboxylating) [Candidatus Pelagibacter sp. RS40]
MSNILLSNQFIKSTCKLALNEDLYPSGDITSDLINNNINKKVKMISNQSGIIGGLAFAKETFKLIDKKIKFKIKKKEGSYIQKGNIVAIIEGNLKNILIGERVALNFVSHISGIASKTNKFVRLAGKKTKVCCTRKTIPNLRVLQKYAVKLGGGVNHRFNLSDEFLIKDNHLSSEKNFENIIKRAIKNKKRKKITVEVDNLKQLHKIYGLKFDTVLLDNMSIKNLKDAVKLVKKKYTTEASGGVNLNNIKKIASTGVDRVSIGMLTQSVSAIDIKLEI